MHYRNLNNSPFKVYWCFCDIKNYNLDKNKSFSIFIAEKMYAKATFYYKIIKQIYNDIENNLYTYRDFRIYLAYNFLFDLNFKWCHDINQKSINQVKQILNEKSYEKDKEFIIQMLKSIKFNSEDTLFKYNEKGNTYCSLLIKRKYISPIYWFKNKELINKVSQVNKENEDHKKLVRCLKILEREVNDA